MRWNVNPVTGVDSLISSFFVDISTRSRRGSLKLVLIPSTTVEGLCSMVVLTHVLKAENITFTVSPSSSWEGVQSILESVVTSTESNTVFILLGCGAPFDIKEELQRVIDLRKNNMNGACPPKEPDFMVYCFDSHRPIHLSNVFEREGKVVVMDEDYLELRDSHIPIQRDTEEEFENDELYLSYYEGNYSAPPSTLLLFDLAEERQVGSSDLFFCSCVSMACKVVKGDFSQGVYQTISKRWFAAYKGKYCSDSFNGENSNTEPPMSIENAQSALTQGVTLSEDLAFCFYRHLPLSDSVFLSSRIHGMGELSTDVGKQSLSHFFAEAGIPKSAYQQRYCAMPLAIRNGLLGRLKKYGSRHGFFDLTHLDFIRRGHVNLFSNQLRGSQSSTERQMNIGTMSAVDVAYTLDAVLNFTNPTHYPNTNESNLAMHNDNNTTCANLPINSSDGVNDATPGTSSSSSQQLGKITGRSNELGKGSNYENSISSFNKAISIIRSLTKSPSLLCSGLQLSICVQNAAMQQAKQIDTTRSWTVTQTSLFYDSTGYLRYTLLMDPISSPGVFVCESLALICAICVANICRSCWESCGEGFSSVPYLLLWRRDENSYICAGLNPRSVYTKNKDLTEMKNTFGVLYETASATSGIEHMSSGFDPRIVVIMSSAVQTWLQAVIEGDGLGDSSGTEEL